ncbi:jg4073 [Pararge aegeria aegeria]|uniref:Jg4073 protein n=1 Tax=Pararge aegeria aegeria TaxID=348720 RepID=A0A8S4RUI7_9NEOP|nr:jg4073 [Pararge aegeria aegeria]
MLSNPLYAEEEEQEVVIIVDEEVPEVEVPDEPRVPRRAPSTSSGYGSAGGSHGRVSPNLPKNEQYEPEPERRLSSEKNDGSLRSTTDSDGSPSCTLSRSLKEDIRACLGGCREYPVKRTDLMHGIPIRWERDIGDVVEAAVRGAGGISAARARLHAALLALHEPPPNRGPSLPYCGPGVRPGDVTMMPKTEMSLLAPWKPSLFSWDKNK